MIDEKNANGYLAPLLWDDTHGLPIETVQNGVDQKLQQLSLEIV